MRFVPGMRLWRTRGCTSLTSYLLPLAHCGPPPTRPPAPGNQPLHIQLSAHPLPPLSSSAPPLLRSSAANPSPRPPTPDNQQPLITTTTFTTNKLIHTTCSHRCHAEYICNRLLATTCTIPPHTTLNPPPSYSSSPSPSQLLHPQRLHHHRNSISPSPPIPTAASPPLSNSTSNVDYLLAFARLSTSTASPRSHSCTSIDIDVASDSPVRHDRRCSRPPDVLTHPTTRHPDQTRFPPTQQPTNLTNKKLNHLTTQPLNHSTTQP